MATRMQQRRGTAAQWTAANPVLAAGEIGFETDTNKFKMGNGSSAWSALQYFANAAELAAIIDSAPEALNTLNELAAAIGDDANFVGTVTSHTSATTNVHGITNTATLATTSALTAAATQVALDAAADATSKANAAQAAAEATASADATAKANAAYDSAGTTADAKIGTHNSDTTNVHGIADTSLLATQEYADIASTTAITTAGTAADTKIATHNNVTTGVHGIADTSLLATQEYADDAAALAITTAATDATNKANAAEADAITAAGTAADTKVTAHNNLTENVHGIADTSFLVTQTQLTNAINGAEVNQAALAGDGIVWGSTNSEFDLDENYITTATQTALDLKAPLANPTFTGTVSGVTKSMVGLGNVDNTSDANKPVSTATASAIATAKSEAIADATSQVNAVIASAPAALNTLDELAAALGDDANFATTVTNSLAAKAPLASPTFTGTVTLPAEGIVFSDGTQAKAGVPSITTFATAISSSATLAAGEQDKFVPLTGAVTITLPATGYSTGQSIDFYQASGTGAQFASTNSVVGTPGLKFRTTNSVVTAMKTSSGWLVFGDLSA